MAFIPIERTSCLDSAINIDRLSGAMFTQENEAHQFVITCTQNNAQLTLTGTITAKVVLANGNTVELVGTIDGGKAVVTLTQPCYNTAGRIQISIFNTVGSTKLCIYAAIAYVQTAEHGELIDGSQIIDSVEDLIADIQAAVATIPPDYSTLSNQVADLKSAIKKSFDLSGKTVPDFLTCGDDVLSYSGNSSGNSLVTVRGAFPLIPVTKFGGKFITKIELTVETVGNLTIGIYPDNMIDVGVQYDNSLFQQIETVTATATGQQTFVFSHPLYIPYGYSIAFGSRLDDTMKFYYGTGGIDFGFYRYNSGSFSKSSNQSLGIDIYTITMPLKQNEFFNGVNTSYYKNDVIAYDGYNDDNDSASQNATTPFFPDPLIENKIVYKIKMKVKTAGTISFGIYKATNITVGEAYDSSKYERKTVVTLETGVQEIVFNTPIFVPAGCAFCIGSPRDSGKFAYGSNGFDKGFYGTNNGNFSHLNSSIGISVYCIDWNINKIESTEKGKKLSIFGDSISTFKGWIPEGNAVYYTGTSHGVSKVQETWWMKTIMALGYELLVNNSWSGRAVSSVRDGNPDHATSGGYREQNVLQLKSGNVLPDVIIIKMGINDYNLECPLGNYDGSTALPSDPSTFTNAYAMMLDLIMTNFPLAKVYCCTLMQCEQNGDAGFPEINGNGESLTAFNNAIRQLAHAFGAEVLDHDTCGLTYYNMAIYMGDYNPETGKGLHPNAAGHSLIANQTIHQIDNAVRIRY